jgi:nucleotide-binding universal stress UspA family protein
MTMVLAALDNSAVAPAVMETALRIGELCASDVEAVHVVDGPDDAARSLAESERVPLRLLEGSAGPALLDALCAPNVVAVVIGARTELGGRRPVGRIARQILEQTTKPVVVVPPESPTPPRLRRLLLPLEGTDEFDGAVPGSLWQLLVADVELVVLHVFTEDSLPRMLDRPARDLELLGKEFLARHFPHTDIVELRPGPVALRVAEVSEEQAVDLVVLSWSQDTSTGHAVVLQEVLGASRIPLLLLPVARSEGNGIAGLADEPPAQRP